MNALGWLDDFWGWISKGTGGNAVGSIILVIIVIFFMWFVVRSPEQHPATKPKE
jgi:hypothetical protein